MKQRLDHDELMIRYLLGELSEQEQTEFEQQYFVDDDFFEHLLHVENDLIDRYLQGELSPGERERFERCFLSSPHRQQRVEFARALKKLVSEAPEPKAPAVAGPISRWHSLLAFLRPRKPVILFPLATAALVLVVGASWLIVETLSLRNQLEQLRTERGALERREQGLEQQVVEQRGRNDQLAEELRREQNQRGLLENELARQQQAAPNIVSLVLTAGLVREINEPKRLILPAAADWVQLQVDLERDDYKSYRAVLRTAEGAEIWSQGMLKAPSPRSGKTLELMLPTSLLTKQDYILTVGGVTAAGKVEDFGDYYFRIVRK